MIAKSATAFAVLALLFAVALVTVSAAPNQQGVQSLVVERSEDRRSATATWNSGGVEYQAFSVAEKVIAGEDDPEGDGINNDSLRWIGGLLTGDVSTLEIPGLNPNKGYQYVVYGAARNDAGDWTISSQTTEDEQSAVYMDREALVALYNATGGANWRENTNWLSSAPLGRWYGVEADSDGRVVEVSLWLNKLEGELPSELGNLAKLERLSLPLNSLSGDVPSELGMLSNLKELTLIANRLTGEIPVELGGLTNLEKLYLSVGNRFTGCIPSALQNVAVNDLSELGLPFCS